MDQKRKQALKDIFTIAGSAAACAGIAFAGTDIIFNAPMDEGSKNIVLGTMAVSVGIMGAMLGAAAVVSRTPEPGIHPANE